MRLREVKVECFTSIMEAKSANFDVVKMVEWKGVSYLMCGSSFAIVQPHDIILAAVQTSNLIVAIWFFESSLREAIENLKDPEEKFGLRSIVLLYRKWCVAMWQLVFSHSI